MKIAILGDVHIGASHGLGEKEKDGTNSRQRDYEATLDWVAEYCFDNDIEVIVQTGDLFEHRNPSRHDMDVAENFLKKVSAYGITTQVIMGNHDYKKSGTTYTSSLQNLSIDGFHEVSIYIKPDVAQVINSVGERVNIILMPFRDKRMYEGKKLSDKTLEFNNEILELIDKCNQKYPTIFVGHNFIYEGSYNDFGGTEVFAMRDTFYGIEAAFMGHYHTSKQFINKKGKRVFYTGSMEKNNFGDKKNDKFLFIYDTKLDEVTKVKMPVRDLIEVDIDLTNCEMENIYESLNKSIDSYNFSKKIARVCLKIKESHSPLLHKDKIEKKILKRGAHFVSRVLIDSVQEQLVRDLAPLREEDDLNMLKKYLKMQGDDENRILNLMKKAKLIMTE
jgi:exonuclease SbcD